MSDLSQDEVDRLLMQLIEQTAPDRPSDEEATAIVRWAELIRFDDALLELVLEGGATVRIDADGKPSFRITPRGQSEAQALLGQSPTARALFDRLVAGGRLAKGPNDAQ